MAQDLLAPNLRCPSHPERLSPTAEKGHPATLICLAAPLPTPQARAVLMEVPVVVSSPGALSSLPLKLRSRGQGLDQCRVCSQTRSGSFPETSANTQDHFCGPWATGTRAGVWARDLADPWQLQKTPNPQPPSISGLCPPPSKPRPPKNVSAFSVHTVP